MRSGNSSMLSDVLRVVVEREDVRVSDDVFLEKENEVDPEGGQGKELCFCKEFSYAAQCC